MTYRELYFVYEPYFHPTRVLALARTFKDRKLISEQVVKIVDSKGMHIKKSTLYFVAPLDVSPETPAYQKALFAAQQFWPFHIIFESSAQNWDRLPTLDILLILPRVDGSIAMECYQQILDCQERDIPILTFAYNTSEFCSLTKVMKVPFKHRNPDYYAFIYPHSLPGYWEYAPDELSKVWVESNSEKTGIKSCLN